MNTLIVDDVAENIQVTMNLLKEDGHSFVAVEVGRLMRRYLNSFERGLINSVAFTFTDGQN